MFCFDCTSQSSGMFFSVRLTMFRAGEPANMATPLAGAGADGPGAARAGGGVGRRTRTAAKPRAATAARDNVGMIRMNDSFGMEEPNPPPPFPKREGGEDLRKPWN